MPRGQRKDYVPISLDDLTSSVVAAPEEAARLAPPARGFTPAERSPVQKQFDTYVTDLHTFWMEHGKPVPFTDAYPPRKVFVTPDQAATVRLIANGSARFAGYAVRYGSDTPTTDGRVCVSFCVTDKRERKSGKSAE